MEDFDLDSLREQLKQLQEKPAEERFQLTDRNGVDLVLKLIERSLVHDLVFSADGKEYVTQVRLEQEVLRELQRQGGRLSTFDLAPLLNVSLSVAEAAAAHLVSTRGRSLRMLDGELISTQYMDSVAAEVAEMLELSDRGMLSAGDLAVRFALPLDFFSQQVLEPRVGTVLKGTVRIDGTMIYNQTYVDWHRAHARGLLTAATRPTAIAPFVSAFKLTEKLFVSVVHDLIRSGRLDGTLVEHSHYVPASFEQARIAWARSFFSANKYIDYQMVSRMQVHDAKSYVQAALPNVVGLSSCAVDHSVVEALDAAAAAAVSDGTATDLSVLIPAGIEERDVATLLRKVRALAEDDDGHVQAVVIAQRYVVSTKFINMLLQKFEESYKKLADAGELEAIEPSRQEAQKGGKQAGPKGGKRGGKAGGKRGKQHRDDDDEDDEEEQRSKTPVQVPQKAREEVAKKVGEWLGQLQVTGSLETVGEMDDLATQLSAHVAPRAFELRLAAVEAAALSAVSVSAADAREQAQQLQEAAASAFLDVWLASRALADVPEADAAAVDKHLQRTLGFDLVSVLARSQAQFHHVSLEGVANDAEPAEIVRKLPAEAAAPIKGLLDLLAKSGTAEFVEEAPGVAMDLGFRLRKPDSAQQARRLAQHVEKFEESLAEEKRPPAALHMAVMLMHTRLLRCYLPAPPKCLHVLVARLQEHVPPPQYKAVREYQQQVVAYLRAPSASGEAKLAELLPGIKQIALATMPVVLDAPASSPHKERVDRKSERASERGEKVEKADGKAKGKH